jgi:AcrR family transcriptional regulator
MAKQKKIQDVSTEEKIKQAARKLFTEKGFDAVKTRDIAAEAGINLALLNYYFRGKDKLYEIVMFENMHQFLEGLIPVLGDENLPVEEIMAKAAGSYIDMLMANPDLPFFILNAMRDGSPRLNHLVAEKMSKARSGFMKRIGQAMKDGKVANMHMGHFMANFMGLVIFPFVAKPIMMQVHGIGNKEFDSMMEERKDLVPIWLKAIMKAK